MEVFRSRFVTSSGDHVPMGDPGPVGTASRLLVGTTSG